MPTIIAAHSIRLVLVAGSAANYSERNNQLSNLTMQPMAALVAAFMLTLQSTALRPHNTRRNKGLRAAATSEDLLAEAAALRREANAMEADLEAEIAPPPAPAPKPKPTPTLSPSLTPTQPIHLDGHGETDAQ